MILAKPCDPDKCVPLVAIEPAPRVTHTVGIKAGRCSAKTSGNRYLRNRRVRLL